jgi:hypothetical protein
MRSPHRCKCDECRSTDMVLRELDYVVPPRTANRERKIIRATAE